MLGLWYHFLCSCHSFSSQSWEDSENSLAKTVNSGFIIWEFPIWDSLTAQKYYAWIHVTQTIESWKILEYQSIGLKLQFVISWKTIQISCWVSNFVLVVQTISPQRQLLLWITLMRLCIYFAFFLMQNLELSCKDLTSRYLGSPDGDTAHLVCAIHITV